MLKSATVKESTSPWIIISIDNKFFWDGEKWVKLINLAKTYGKYMDAANSIKDIPTTDTTDTTDKVLIGEQEFYNGLDMYNLLQDNY